MVAIAVIACARKNRTADKPYEDASAVRLDQQGAVLVIADGVTRSRSAGGAYPQPSGAAIAAQLVAQTLGDALVGADCGGDIAYAFALANRAVGEANRRHRIWETLDYGEHDLWGAVATAVVASGRVARWGHIGDSVLLHMPAGAGLTVATPDQVRAATNHLATLPADELSAGGGREQYARRRLRNQPAVEPSYGVLTGEPAAEHYVVTGEFPVAAGDHLVLSSDGLGSLCMVGEGEAGWRHLEPWLRHAVTVAGAERLLDAAEEADERRRERSDDKTVIVATLGG